MDAKGLRRTQMHRELAGFLSLPAIYFLLMLAGVFLWSPSMVLVSFLLVLMLLLTRRSSLAAGRVAPKEGPAVSVRPPPQKALEAADERFLAAVNFSVAANVAGYLVFLAAVDFWVRSTLAGARESPAVLVGAVLGIAVALAGRELGRRRAWKGFGQEFPRAWQAPEWLASGAAARTPATYLEWRASVERGP